MAPGGKHSSAGKLARLRTMSAAGIALFSGALLGGIALFGWAANETAFEQESTLVENAFNELIKGSLSQAKSVAWWDAAVIKTRARDRDFLDNEFGQLLTETYNQDEIYVLDANDQAFYGFGHGERLPAGLFRRYLPEAAALIEEVRRSRPSLYRQRPDLFGASQDKYRVLGGVQRARWAGHILTLDGRPAVVTAITIVPNVDLRILTGKPMLLVGVSYIDARVIGAIGRSLLLPDLRLSPVAPRGSALARKRFVTDDGVRIGELSWTTKQPGQLLLGLIFPLAAIALAAVGGMLLHMFGALKKTSAELALSEERARHDALHDSLSGLANRRNFMASLADALADRRKRVTAAYLDIDRFKEVNDTMGHHAGDLLIREVSGRLRQRIRRDDFLARLGGDEFAVFSVGAAARDHLARRIAEVFAEPFDLHGQPIRMTASAGVAIAEHGDGADELMRRADIALYEAKARGRDRAILFDRGMSDKVTDRRAIELDLRQALETSDLEMHFQPYICTRTGKVAGAEALLRWTHPQKGPIGPAQFIPIAEGAGIMPALGEWVLRRSLEAAARWPTLEISVNLSPVQLRVVDFPALLRGLIAEHGVNPDKIVLEVTEGILLEKDLRTKAALEAIRQIGCRLALDDFGTGYSSLAYLCEFKFDKIKVDRTVVAGVSRGSVPRAVLDVIGALGRDLGMDVLAEGIESETDSAVVRQAGCTQMQGYHFSKAISADALEALLARNTFAAARRAAG